MSKKTYKTSENDEQMILNEPVATYQRKPAKTSPSGRWNPNVPFHGTQEEWWEHFHRIEEGNFMTLEEADRKFEAWKEEYLANKLTAKVSPSDKWNPNVPFHGTQEEWWEHFHHIEEGNFTPLEEANREFEAWKKEYLASRLK